MRREHHKAASKRAFTLVELLVVIGIIAVLISVLLPALNRARAASNSVYCLSNLKQIGLAMQLYATAHKGSLPIAYWDGVTSPNNEGATDWAWLILPYLKRNAASTYSGGGDDPAGLWKLFKDVETVTGEGSAALDTQKTQTYGVNQVFFGFSAGPISSTAYPATIGASNGAQAGPGDDAKKPFKFGQIKRSSEMVLVIDAAQIGNQGSRPDSWASDADLTFMQGTNYDCRLMGLDALVAKYPAGLDAGLNKDYRTYTNMQIDKDTARNSRGNDLRFRHIKNTTANALLADGSANSFRYKQPGPNGSDLKWSNFVPSDLRYVVKTQ